MYTAVIGLLLMADASELLVSSRPHSWDLLTRVVKPQPAFPETISFKQPVLCILRSSSQLVDAKNPLISDASGGLSQTGIRLCARSRRPSCCIWLLADILATRRGTTMANKQTMANHTTNNEVIVPAAKVAK